MAYKNKIILPPTALKSCVGILGGSFDPPHLGHELLALSFLALEPIDELWILPCASHASKTSLSSFKHRLALCKRGFSHLKNIRIVALEEHLVAPNYTYKTLEAIKNLRPDLKLMWGLGSDLIASFSSWHQASKLSLLADFVIFERENYSLKPMPKILSTARIHQGYVLPDTNSTALRLALAEKQECPFLNYLVLSYIKKHGLYK